MQSTASNGRVKVAIADSMTLFREGLVSLLNESPYTIVVANTGHATELRSLCEKHDPDVVVIELSLLRSNGDYVLSTLQTKRKSRRLVGILDDGCDDGVLQIAEKAGISTIRRMDTSVKLIETLNSEPEAKQPVAVFPRPRKQELSPREREVAALIARGTSNKSIAEALGLSEQSIKNLVSRILRKLRLTNRVQIALYSKELGL